jgi:hypothetical protein
MNLPKAVLLSLSFGCLFTGCESVSALHEQTPSVTVCPVHHVPLVKTAGYLPSEGNCVVPTEDYIGFMAEISPNPWATPPKYPFSRPHELVNAPKSGWNKRTVELVCPECDKRFNADLAAYEKLDESTKKARYRAHLRRRD